jgi:Ca-activated chloride channel homolog
MKAHSAFAIIALLLLCVAVFPPAAACQSNPNRPPWAQKPNPASGTSSPAPVTKQAAPPGTIVDRSAIRVNVNLVNVLVSVLDEHNRPAPDLPLQAFHVFEEGNPQKIAIFEKETQQPLDLALMIDASLSTQLDMPAERAAAEHFIEQVLRPGDRLAVFSFDENVIQRSDFSDRVKDLQAAVAKIPEGAGTSIYDAVYLGARALERQGGERRRVIVLITDGGETTSHMDFDTARNQAVKAEALLYTILIRPIMNEGGRNTAGEHALQTITDATGGAMFFPQQPSDLAAIFDEINRELRTQYRLGYYPDPPGPPNTYRTIVVQVSGNYLVRHRKTYYTGSR